MNRLKAELRRFHSWPNIASVTVVAGMTAIAAETEIDRSCEIHERTVAVAADLVPPVA